LLLTESGYQVREACTGRSGLAKIEAGPLDAAVLDLRLPDMDGYALCRHIRARIPALPILIVTANLAPAFENRAREAGATDVLRKPFLPAQLLDWQQIGISRLSIALKLCAHARVT